MDPAGEIGNVFRCGSAAAADPFDAQSHITHGIGGKIFRTAHGDHASVHRLGRSRIGLGDHRIRRDGNDLFHHKKHGFRSDPAVDPEGSRLDGRGFEQIKDLHSCGAIRKQRLFIKFTAEHVRFFQFKRLDRIQHHKDIILCREGLEQDKIAGLRRKDGKLFLKDRGLLFPVVFNPLRQLSDGSDIPCHQQVRTGGFPGECNACAVDLRHFVTKTELVQFVEVGTVCIGGDDLRSGVTVRHMDRPHRVPVVQAQTFIRGIDKKVLLVKFRPHCAVKDSHSVFQSRFQPVFHVLLLINVTNIIVCTISEKGFFSSGKEKSFGGIF